MKFHANSHLAYCTNIHPAESWPETELVLRRHVLAVRDLLRQHGDLGPADPFAIGLRLSAKAAAELLTGDHLPRFRDWLAQSNSYVFTINGFPYGSFHGTRVKEKVFQPDWSTPERLAYTKQLFQILAAIARPDTGASVSTLPGSHKTFHPDETPILRHLAHLATWLDELSESSSIDLHLGLEPEPLGHFENTAETLEFFDRLHSSAPHVSDALTRRIGLNYDSCHFALEFDQPAPSLDSLRHANIRLSKIHISSALAFDPRDPAARAAIRPFDEPTYFHQVLLRDSAARITRHKDLPDYLAAPAHPDHQEARVHFHIPLDSKPAPPLRSTRSHARDTLRWCRQHPDACSHFEIETYTWAVLPANLQRPVEQQIAGEYRWVLHQA